MKKTSDAQKRAVAKYDAANTKSHLLKLNKNTDADIIAHLNQQPNKLAYLKKLIRDDMEKR